MDCDAFRASEIDALYGELDPAASAAMEAHAAECTSCAARMEKLRATRSAFGALIVPAPEGLEAKVLAAAAAATPKPRAQDGGKVIRFLARPQLALAAGFVLVAGAALFYGGTRMRSRPAAVADQSEAKATPAPSATAVAEGVAAPTAAASAAAPADDPAVVAARTAFENGQYGSACTQLDALAKTNDVADLYATKCLARTKGCAAAAPRFDGVAQRNVGNETGSRAELEAARCYRAINDARANERYAALKDDPWVGDEAKNDQAPAAVAARKAIVAQPPAATAASQAGARAAGGVARPAPRPAAKPASPPANMGF